MVNNKFQLEVDATPVFDHLVESINARYNNNYVYKIIVSRGGTRSSKTYSTVQILVIWLVTGKIGDRYWSKGTCDIVRKWGVTLKGTVMVDIDDVINDLGLRVYIEQNKTDRTYKSGTRIIRCIGSDDSQKNKGRKRDILYCNEANELEFLTDFFQLLIRTKDLVIIDFNPDDEDIWINTELELKRQYIEKDVKVIVSTYKDNPFLSEGEVKEIEGIKNIDLGLWQVYGEGGYGKVQGLIYNNWEIIPDIPEDAELDIGGLDFGFSNDPCSLLELYKWDGGFVINEILYETGLTNEDINERAKTLGYDIRTKTYADSAEPKSIEELRRLKRSIVGTQKGKDSINFGIQAVKKFKLYITARSTNVIKEIRKYKWEVDKNGNSTKKPIDKFNHAMDGLRYAIATKYAKRGIEMKSAIKGNWMANKIQTDPLLSMKARLKARSIIIPDDDDDE